ncbi:MAG: DUF3179 domain-containing protein [Nitrospirae bacterium]|nr:DUF3179 domain-containing protein [Nitrospirota bacterium]
MNGFDLTKRSIALDQIVAGGPPRDGIPALTDPTFVPASSAAFLQDDDRVIGLQLNGPARAYPIKILNWHEVVNDRVGGAPVVVTYCPLCGTGMVFDALIHDRRALFGVSGLLSQSDVLLYDRDTESLWSQLRQEAVTGARIGTRLTLLPALHTTWGAWRTEHPETLVLSTDTGHARDYQTDPYRGYASTPRLFFDVAARDSRLHPKEWVLGVERGGQTKAYPFSVLETRDAPVCDRLGDQPIVVHFDPKTRTARATDPNGRPIPSVAASWFAWYAFHPDTAIYRPEPE